MAECTAVMRHKTFIRASLACVCCSQGAGEAERLWHVPVRDLPRRVRGSLHHSPEPHLTCSAAAYILRRWVKTHTLPQTDYFFLHFVLHSAESPLGGDRAVFLSSLRSFINSELICRNLRFKKKRHKMKK